VVATTAKITTVVASPRTTVNPEAAKHGAELRYRHIDSVRDLGERVRNALRALRAQIGAGAEAADAKAAIQAHFAAAKLMPNNMAARRRTQRFGIVKSMMLRRCRHVRADCGDATTR
jgi:hypothetical protein